MTRAVAQLSASIAFDGDYEATGDVLYLSTDDDDKWGSCFQTHEGHAVRFAPDGRVTHMTLIGAKWLLDRDGELVATLPDESQLRLSRADLADLLPD